jgi:hypothetical protein
LIVNFAPIHVRSANVGTSPIPRRGNSRTRSENTRACTRTATEVPTEIKDRHPWLQAIDYG